MIHKGFIDINQTLTKVAALFADSDNLKEYQDGFIRKELVSGENGEVGAVSKMYYKHGKNEMELVETITKNDLPHSFEASFHHIHMDNTMKCDFEALDDKTTRYHYEYEYTRINWFMPKLISILFPSMYRKPAEKWLRQFKEFAERQ
ncbi:SRPBCC family protein [Aureibaculum sp. 2210JD6-5]|uniref:SRPBCC family protein n=1 Tax=Aureibaculum sp. 2210JD6-5 TaxID=3103957 RepID=UPI002AAC7E9C|nr:SRPBCC family protein [Aureibaculum sp. 2210JD6-5]MDY7395253.1 SRPBCC family protein [Aureibaculum sp. 2210JD6-5]